MSPTDTRDPLTYRIIGAAIEVHQILGAGLLENIYEDALCIELAERGLSFERQKHLEINYKGHDIGDLFVDIIVEDRVIVELKSVRELAPIHKAQLMTYLRVSNMGLGLLINFNVPNLTQGIQRVVL
ncbi:MAG: GxxExxY protein [Anaerolineae bacterium]|nr:GxxExxY protein [Anaerolineae bacterium]